MEDRRLTAWLLAYREEGDPEAIGALFEETAPRPLRLAMHVARNATEAEDLLQSTFLAAIESADRFEVGRPVLGWLAGILANKAREARRNARLPDPERLIERVAEPPDVTAETAEERQALERAIAELPPLYRRVLELVVGHGLRPAEIAERLERSPAAVRTQLHRGAALLRRALPAGMALPAALVVFESTGLDDVRSNVVRHAQRHAAASGATTTGVAGTKAIAICVGAALGVGVLGLATWLGGSERSEVAAVSAPVVCVATPEGTGGEPLRFEAEPESPEPARSIVELPNTGEAPEAPAPVAAAGSDSRPPVTFELRVPEEHGIDLEHGTVVPADDADIVFPRYPRDNVVRATERASLFAIPESKPLLHGRPCSGDAYLRSIVAANPALLQPTDELDVREYEPSTRAFLARRAEGGWAAVAVLECQRDLVSGRHELLVRGVFHPTEPRFRPDVVRVPASAFLIDASAFRKDPWRDEQDQRHSAALGELDHAVAEKAPGARTDRDAEPRVRGVLTRQYASSITCGSWDYTSSTFSFDHDTRDDVAVTHNDWSMAAQIDGSINVRMAGNDRSELWHIGNEGLQALPPASTLSKPQEEWTGAVAGDVFLIHTLDADTERWDLLEVLEVRPQRWLIFQWAPYGDEAWLDELARARVRDQPPFAGRVFVLACSGGGTDGNPRELYLDGTKNMYVDVVEDELLDFDHVPEPGPSGHGYVEAGALLPDQTWQVQSIEFRMVSNDEQRSRFRIVLGGETVVELPPRAGPRTKGSSHVSADGRSGVWNGALSLDASGLARSFVEVRDGRIEATFRGVVR